MRKLIFMVISVMLFSGCQNANEIDKRNFVMASGADKNEEGEIVFTVGCAVPKPDSDTNIKSVTEKKTGNDISVFMPENEENYGRNIYFGHMKAIVLGRSFFDGENLRLFADMWRKRQDINEEVSVLYADNAQELIEKTKETDEGNNLDIWDYYKNNISEREKISLSFLETAKNEAQGEVYFIPKINSKNEESRIEGGCAVKNGKILFELPKEFYDGFAILAQKGGGVVLKNREKVFQIKKTKTSFKFYEDNGLKCNVEIAIKGNENNFLYEFDEKTLMKDAENKVEKCFEFLRENNADIIGVTKNLKKQNSRLYEKYGKENAFKNIKADIKCRIL